MIVSITAWMLKSTFTDQWDKQIVKFRCCHTNRLGHEESRRTCVMYKFGIAAEMYNDTPV